MIKPMDVTPEVIDALQTLRLFGSGPALPGSVRAAFKVLEETGVFAEIDEVADEDRVPALLADGAVDSLRDSGMTVYGGRWDPDKTGA